MWFQSQMQSELLKVQLIPHCYNPCLKKKKSPVLLLMDTWEDVFNHKEIHWRPDTQGDYTEPSVIHGVHLDACTWWTLTMGFLGRCVTLQACDIFFLLFCMQFWFRTGSASASHLSGQLGAEAHRTACGLRELRNQREIETKCCLRACGSFYRAASGMCIHWSVPFETLLSCTFSRALDVWPSRRENSSLVHTTNTWPMGLSELCRHADIPPSWAPLCEHG